IRLMTIDRQDVQKEGQGGDDEDGPKNSVRSAPKQEKQERPYDVELLLDSERPEMQQRDAVRVRSEISGLKPEIKIGDEGRACKQLLAQPQHVLRQQNPPSRNSRGSQHQNESRKDPAYPSRVE